jgi:hypothetical protein
MFEKSKLSSLVSSCPFARVPEELDSMLQLLEAENPFAHVMREDPSMVRPHANPGSACF